MKRIRSVDLVIRFSRIIGWWKRLFWLRLLFPSIQFVVLALCIKVSAFALIMGAILAFVCYQRFAPYFSDTDQIQHYTLFHFMAAMYTIGQLLLSVGIFNFWGMGGLIFSLSVGLSLAYWSINFDDFILQFQAYQETILQSLFRPQTYQRWLEVLGVMMELTLSASLLVVDEWIPTVIYFLTILVQISLVSGRKGQGLNQTWTAWHNGRSVKQVFASFVESYGRQQTWRSFGLWNTVYYMLFQIFSLMGLPWLSLSGFSIILPVVLAVFSMWVSKVIFESELNPVRSNTELEVEMNGLSNQATIPLSLADNKSTLNTDNGLKSSDYIVQHADVPISKEQSTDLDHDNTQNHNGKN